MLGLSGALGLLVGEGGALGWLALGVGLAGPGLDGREGALGGPELLPPPYDCGLGGGREESASSCRMGGGSGVCTARKK